MPHRMARVGLVSMALVAGAGLQAQSLQLPASDPVSIGRSGVGVAFGRSLEASGLNPALLVTLQEQGSAYVGLGMAHASQQVTQQANTLVKFSSDRNRVLPSLGAAWKPSDRVAFGLRAGTGLLRHGTLPDNAPVRFHGLRQDLRGDFFEAQAGLALTPALSLGLAVTALQVDHSFDNIVRLNVLSDGTQGPVTTLGLAEVALRQEGRKSLVSGLVGLRYAFGPRYTLGLTYRSAAKGDVATDATMLPGVRGVYATDGSSLPYAGIEKDVQRAVAGARVVAGSPTLELPAVLTLGFRHRVNQVFTWEVDIKSVQGSRMQVPGLARLASSPAAQPGDERVETRNATAFSGMGEITLGKRWTARFGLLLESPLVDDQDVDHLYGRGRQASFSAGTTWKGLGGELSFGYVYRQAQDAETLRLDGKWESTGYRRTGTLLRVEGQGHLWSVGYKVAF